MCCTYVRRSKRYIMFMYHAVWFITGSRTQTLVIIEQLWFITYLILRYKTVFICKVHEIMDLKKITLSRKLNILKIVMICVCMWGGEGEWRGVNEREMPKMFWQNTVLNLVQNKICKIYWRKLRNCCPLSHTAIQIQIQIASQHR